MSENLPRNVVNWYLACVQSIVVGIQFNLYLCEDRVYALEITMQIIGDILWDYRNRISKPKHIIDTNFVLELLAFSLKYACRVPRRVKVLKLIGNFAYNFFRYISNTPANKLLAHIECIIHCLYNKLYDT